MKQQGDTWYTYDGKPTPTRYVPAREKLYEKLAQKIAHEAEALDQQLFSTRKMFIDICKEAVRNNVNKDIQRRFTFYTFDREYKIEFDIKEEYVRVYRATKANPGTKDYDLINLDINSKSIVTLETLKVGSVEPTEEDLKWGREEMEKYKSVKQEEIPYTQDGNPSLMEKMMVEGTIDNGNHEEINN